MERSYETSTPKMVQTKKEDAQYKNDVPEEKFSITTIPNIGTQNFKKCTFLRFKFKEFTPKIPRSLK